MDFLFALIEYIQRYTFCFFLSIFMSANDDYLMIKSISKFYNPTNRAIAILDSSNKLA